MRKGNYIYLGVAAVFLTLAVIQFFMPTLLPVPIYVYISWASFILTLLELIKAILNCIKNEYMLIVDGTNEENDLCNRQIAAFDNFKELENEVALNERFHEMLKRRMKNNKKASKSIEILEKIVDIITICQIIFLFTQFAFVLVLRIPNSLSTNKTIGVLGLLSFALVVFTGFLNSSIDKTISENRRRIDDSKTISMYYLNIIERIAEKRKNDDPPEDNV